MAGSRDTRIVASPRLVNHLEPGDRVVGTSFGNPWTVRTVIRHYGKSGQPDRYTVEYEVAGVPTAHYTHYLPDLYVTVLEEVKEKETPMSTNQVKRANQLRVGDYAPIYGVVNSIEVLEIAGQVESIYKVWFRAKSDSRGSVKHFVSSWELSVKTDAERCPQLLGHAARCDRQEGHSGQHEALWGGCRVVWSNSTNRKYPKWDEV